MNYFRVLLVLPLVSVFSSDCVCTTVDCPKEGINRVIMGNGNAHIDYVYDYHDDQLVVASASGTIYPDSLNYGTETTSCTQKYSRMLEDDGNQNCDAGHILANHLGGYGNIPTNIFPQDLSINRGSYAHFENDIYECMMSGANSGYLQWKFTYKTNHTMPYQVDYQADFENGNCTHIQSQFSN